MRDFVRAKTNDFSLEIFMQQGGKPVLDAKRTAHFASGVGKKALAACLSQKFKGKVHNRETLGAWWMTFDHVAKAGQWTVSGETPSLEDLGNRPGHGLISRERWALVGGDGKALSKAFGQCITQKALGTLDVPNDPKAKFSARLTAWSPY